MAFPTIPTVAGGRVLFSTEADTTTGRTFPNLSSLTKSAGDLLLAIIYCYQTGGSSGTAFSSWGAGFSEFADLSTIGQDGFGCAYKISDGTEAGTFNVTQATPSGHAAMMLLCIPGAALSAPEVGAIVRGTSTAANPASLSPSWGAADTLWIAVAGAGETGTGGTFTGLGASPTNYSGDVLSGISADAVGGSQIGAGFRQLNAASEDAATWTLDTSNAKNAAIVIAVRPGPATAFVTASDTALSMSDSLARTATHPRAVSDTAAAMSDSINATKILATPGLPRLSSRRRAAHRFMTIR